ncbi:MAG TPA: oligosaccharide flippase family protein [Gemmatimonadales bacterium]|jgi:O-antigen/teichoic acid export membrane protein|nr:oligosaccharide flippase family protein [Gemmatimonadales bacterium]
MATDASRLAVSDAAAPKPATLTQRATLTAVASLLDYTARAVVGLVAVPILVSGLGRSLYGVWEILSRLIAYMTGADGRPTEALRLTIANHLTRSDETAKRRLIGSAVFVWLLFLPVVAAVGAVLVWLAPTFAKVAPAEHATVRVTCALLVISFLLGSLASIPESVLRGANLGYKRMGYQAGLSVVGGVFMTGAVWLGLGLRGLAWSQIALALVTGVCFWWLVRQFVPWFGVARPSIAEVKSLLNMSVWLSAGDVIAKLLLASDVLVLGLLVSSSAVTSYVLTGYSARLGLNLYALAAGAATPGLGGVIGERQHGRAAKIREDLLAVTWLFATVVGTTILVWNRAFLGLWVGNQNYAGVWPNVLLVLVTAQSAFIRNDSYVIDAALRPRLRVLFGTAAAAITIALMVLLTPTLGIVGVCLGLLGGRLIQTVAYPIIVRSCLGAVPASASSTTLQWTRRLLAMAALFGGATWLGQRVTVAHWATWAAGVALTVLLLPALAWALGLNAAGRQAVLERFRGVLGGVRRWRR